MKNFDDKISLPIGTNEESNERDSLQIKSSVVGNSNFIRLSVLLLLCFQNAGHALVTRYSQGVLHEKYSSTEIILASEFIKLLFSGYMTLYSTSESEIPAAGVWKLTWLLINAKKIVVLVLMYSAMNLLCYFALARVEAAVYTVLSQLKILSTAGFTVAILGRNVSSTKWRALVLLVIGCILVASPSIQTGSHSSTTSSKTTRLRRLAQIVSVDDDADISSALAGVGAILLMVTLSGYSSVYFEGMLKQAEKIGIWERNFQLAAYSIFVMLFIMLIQNGANISSSAPSFNFFGGWSLVTCAVVVLQAGGGLLVAATLKYADSIMKTLATAGAIAMSTVLSHFILGGVLDMVVGLGCLSTILAVFNYSFDSTVDSLGRQSN